MDLVLNNLQYLMCHKTKPNETNLLSYTSAQSTMAVEYTGRISAEDYHPRPTSVLDMTLKHLMAMLY